MIQCIYEETKTGGGANDRGLRVDLGVQRFELTAGADGLVAGNVGSVGDGALVAGGVNLVVDSELPRSSRDGTRAVKMLLFH